MAMTRSAAMISADWMQNSPTGPHPHTATMSPGSIAAFSAAIQPVRQLAAGIVGLKILSGHLPVPG
jgi:hypothetical protein